MNRYSDCIIPFGVPLCSLAALHGHLNVLKYLRTELQCEWDPRDVLLEAASSGFTHVLQWAIENGAPLILPDADDTRALHEQLLADCNDYERLETLKWLLATHPSILEHVDLAKVFSCKPNDVRFLEIVASRVGAAKVVQVMQSMFDFLEFTWAPPVVEWWMAQGRHVNADFLHTSMHAVAEYGYGYKMEHFLRLGGVWRPEYIQIALEHVNLSVCEWAHKRGDLKLDFSHVNDLERISKDVLEWLDSVGVHLRVTDAHVMQRLMHDPDALQYVIEHYPRYAFFLLFFFFYIVFVFF